MRTLVIAEAGVNHNGDLQMARELVAVAAAAGADLVKFQTFSADAIVTAAASKADYQQQSTGADESQREMLRKLELSRVMHEDLIACCRESGIGFFSTGFDLDSMRLLVDLGLDRFKVPSGEITNRPYLEFIGRQRKPVIVSTGMATLGEVEAALEILESAGAPRREMTLLHCTTQYPARMEDVNLRAMQSMARAFGIRVGYSDHTSGIEVALAAVALGASVVEKHFTLDRRLPGPDHAASLEPEELSAMVRGIRNLELALGDGVKRPTAVEMANRAAARKSLVAIAPIKAGEAFTELNLGVKRPGTGISPMRWHEFLGRNASRSFAIDELIEL